MFSYTDTAQHETESEDWNHFQRKYGHEGKATKHLSNLTGGSGHGTKKQAFVAGNPKAKNGGILKTLESASALLVQAVSGSTRRSKLTKPGANKGHFLKGSDLC
ncbi:expressed unknown protein [Seminavis robusta]|uniref:Uncharacterized protein n=1 Tax=Seminavis robusta TaxID=568900 RepID=A0A9N8H8I5_9STRA|nr:expressed unknown protein [Seminavis robusta]|eukprot:Sro218_g090010.1 n/a (104) ;mRNA; f:22122-22433